MMDKKQKLVPEIRFKGFTEDWELCKLNGMADFSKGNGYSKADLVEKGHPVILYGRLYTKYETVIETVDSYAELKEKSIISKGGEVIVPASGESTEDISRASVVDIAGVALGGDLNIIKTNDELDPTFLALTISNGSQQKEISKRAQGKSVVHLHNSDLKEINLQFPNVEEQKQIGSFFKKIDNLITLHQRKLKLLEQLKQAYLQQMFPQNGEKVPRLRFANFRGEWEQRKLRQLASLITKGTTPMVKCNSGTVNFVKIESIDNSSGEIIITQKISAEEHEGYLRRSKLRENDILFSIAGTLGRVTSVKPDILPANTNQALAIIRLKSGCLQYVKTYLKGKNVADFIKKNPTTGAQPNLSLEQVSNLEIALPTEKEQEQIGSYFKQLYSFIDLQQKKIDSLKKVKSIYLKSMFI